jgi:enoyl-[acyl-carrier-protein] reductase (NADH)
MDWKRVLSINLNGRWIEAEEVRKTLLFLASEMSSAVTGHILRADAAPNFQGFREKPESSVYIEFKMS